MFNHFRTVLANLDGPSAPLDDGFGEALIPEDYRARLLPGGLAQVRSVFYTSTPDRSLVNYRTAQLLAVVAATPLSSWVTALDPRLTYNLAQSNLQSGRLYQPQIEADDPSLWTVNGVPSSPDYSGTMEWNFLLMVSSGTLSVTSPDGTVTETVLVMNSGLSQRIPLSRSGYSLTLASAEDNTALVRIRNRPQLGVLDFLGQLVRLSDARFLDLFGSETTEPWLTCRNVFRDHGGMTFRVAAAVVALAYRINALTPPLNPEGVLLPAATGEFSDEFSDEFA